MQDHAARHRMDTTDDELLERFRRGDRDAFAHLVRRWEGKVFSLAYRLTGDAEEAREVRQGAFLRLLRAAGHFNGAARFSTYVHRVVVNLCLDRQRAARVREERWSEAPRRPDAVAEPPADRRSQAAETARLVAEAVGSLPAAERAVVVLRHYQGLTFAEIASVLGAPVSTVKSRMTRGLGRLREKLKNVEI